MLVLTLRFIFKAKRDALFPDKVIVKDAEEKASAAPIELARHLVLPLPRTYGEAAEWGTRYVLWETGAARSFDSLYRELSIISLQAEEGFARLRNVPAHDIALCSNRYRQYDLLSWR